MNHKWILSATIVVMLAYQAWRVFDYIRGSLKNIDDDQSFWVALAFLTFTEIGMLVWLHVARPGATTERQESVSSVMVWVDFIGSMILGLADLAVHNTLYAVDLSRIDPILFFAPWLIVVLNVGGWIVFESNDSAEMLAREERHLAHAEHEVEIKARQDAIKEVRANTEGLRRSLAPFYVRDITDRVTGRTAARFNRQAEKIEVLPPGPPAPKHADLRGKLAELISGNGRKVAYDKALGDLDALIKIEQQKIEAETVAPDPTKR